MTYTILKKYEKRGFSAEVLREKQSGKINLAIDSGDDDIVSLKHFKELAIWMLDIAGRIERKEYLIDKTPQQ